MIVETPTAIGPERVPLLIIDEAHQAAAGLRDQAIQASYRPSGNDAYPGVRAPAPADYGMWLAQIVNRVIEGAPGITVLRSTFAVATHDPAMLAPIQRIPHFDTTDPTMIAAVHYLCNPPHGGTNFYRHRRTGYQRIDPTRHPAWIQALARDRQEHGLPPAMFASGSTSSFELLTQAALRFNRLIFYPANCLHSGDLASNTVTPPAEGRLTITSLLHAAGPHWVGRQSPC